MRMMRVSGFGEVFVALDKKSNDLVAIKRVKMVMEDEEIASESKLLKECQSRYIVRYYDVLRRGRVVGVLLKDIVMCRL